MKQQWKGAWTMGHSLKTWFPALLTILLAGGGAQASNQARAYAHGFQNGNLIPNWSFEAEGQTWDTSAHTAGFTIDPRFKISTLGGSAKAVSGSFAGAITGTATGVESGGNFSFYTPYLPLQSFVGTYVISFYYRGSPTGTVRPVIRFYTERNNPTAQFSQFEGEAYTASSNDWTLYTWYMTPPPDTRYFRFALAETQVAGDGGNLYFDDIVMEETRFTPRSSLIEAVKFVDALGRTQQTQSYYSGSKANPLPGWTKSARIRVNTTASGAGINGTLTNFPLMVRLTGSNFTFSEAQSDGQDIRFTDAAGNLLSHEIDTWDGAAQSAILWVNVPKIEGNKTDNDIYMYWANSTQGSVSSGSGAFPSWQNFVDVYHLTQAIYGNNPVGTYGRYLYNSVMERAEASTDNTFGPGVPDPLPFLGTHLGKGLDFQGRLFVEDLWEQILNPSPIFETTTFSAWIRLRSAPANQKTSLFAFGYKQRRFFIENGKLVFEEQIGDKKARWEANSPIPADNTTFKHVALTYRRNANPTIMVDGQVLTTTYSIASNGDSEESGMYTYFGSWSFPPNFADAVFDEMRFESTIRSLDWIKMSYQNQRNGSSVVTVDRTVKANQPNQIVSKGVSYDAWGRVLRKYLPCQSQSGDLADPATCAADPDLPNMGGSPFSQVKYAAEMGARMVEASMPGAANAMGSGHTSKSDYYYVNTLNLPATLAAIEAFPSAPNDTTYLFRWARDPDGNYTLTWTNRKNQLIQMAKNVTRPADFTQWQWAKTRYEYYLNGSLKRTYSPLDMVLATPTTKFSQVSAMNTLGQVTSYYSPDIGLVKQWYNRRGQIRFTQDSGQRAASGSHSYFDYDSRGRLIAKGTFNIATMTQTIADQDIATGGTAKSEKIGYIYDDLSTFQARTGISLSSVMPMSYPFRQDFIAAAHGYGRLICKYNRNDDSPASIFSMEDKLVAEFMLYNREGRIERVFKHFGPIRQENARYQEAMYYYDASGRIEVESIYDNAINGVDISNRFYTYDDQGRLSMVTGGYGLIPIAEFGYTSWGPLKYVLLGGDGTGGGGTRIDYAYHTLGGIREIKATRLQDGKVLYQQFLGYDGKADPAPAAPSNPAPRYTGTITQQLYKLGTEANLTRPIRLVDYTLDELGRMLEAKYQNNTPGSVTNPDGSIKYGFAWNDAGDNDSYFTYDLNGRVTSQKSGGASTAGTYNYKSDSYKLDFVNPPVSPVSTRSMTAGNFEYNGRGAMTYDRSKDVSVEYGWDLLPVRFVKNARSPSVKYEQYQFYDADGRRVSKVEAYFDGNARNWVNAKHYAPMQGRVLKELAQPLSSDGTTGSVTQTPYLYGKSLVGRVQNGNLEFYLMNHQGSLMMSVDRNGFVPVEGDVINDYLAYGDPRKLVSSAGTAPTQGYTGKEFDEIYGLTYFGARHYDAELAYWSSPDPGRQFWSPFAFGPDGINGVDPDGWDWLKYTGSRLLWYGGNYGDESNLINEYSGYSGGDGGAEPLPNGRYKLNLAPEIKMARPVDNNSYDLAANPVGGIETIPPGHEGWGTYRVRLIKVNVNSTRDNFYIHDPTDGLTNTHGCIGLKSCDFFEDLIKFKEAGHTSMDVMVDGVYLGGSCTDDGTGLAKTASGDPCNGTKADPKPTKPVTKPNQGPTGPGERSNRDDQAEVCHAGLGVMGAMTAVGAGGGALGGPAGSVIGGIGGALVGGGMAIGMCWDYISDAVSDAGDYIYRKTGEAKDATVREIRQTTNDVVTEVRQTGRDIYEGAGEAKDAVVDFFGF